MWATERSAGGLRGCYGARTSLFRTAYYIFSRSIADVGADRAGLRDTFARRNPPTGHRIFHTPTPDSSALAGNGKLALTSGRWRRIVRRQLCLPSILVLCYPVHHSVGAASW